MAREEPLMNVHEVRRFFGGDERPVSVQTIYRWISEGKLPKPIKVGRLSRWDRKKCEAALQEMREREV